MRIIRIKIKNFRGIKEADINLAEHSLLIGPNNVGKSTILEALDLALGPDRLNSPDSINEHDFFESKYVENQDEEILLTKISIECHFIDLNDRQRRLFQSHLEFWDKETKQVLGGELPEDAPEERYLLDCLRVGFEGYYDISEDDFITKSFFFVPLTDEDTGNCISKNEKREIGYLYLRFLRTGSRALSLERGSLLDIILRLQEIKLSSWQKILDDLKGVGNQFGSDTDFVRLLTDISSRVKKYTPLANDSERKSTSFEVTNLTRRDLKRNLNLFIGTDPIKHLVPYKNVGSGTINVFLFALISIIADLKKNNGKNVIFAMEEPEIALPPYTQRRIVSEILKISNQSLITTHSPYVMEDYLDKGILLLKNESSSGNEFKATIANFALFSTKAKNVKRSFRNQLSEGLLSKGIIAVEGTSDKSCLHAVSDKLIEFDDTHEHLDALGITLVNSEGAGSINNVGKFFQDSQIKTYAFYDAKEKIDKNLFSIAKEQPHHTLEKLLVDEIPEKVLCNFITEAQKYDDFPTSISVNMLDIKGTVRAVLGARKGYGYEAKLIDLCTQIIDLPITIVNFLTEIENDIRNSTT